MPDLLCFVCPARASSFTGSTVKPIVAAIRTALATAAAVGASLALSVTPEVSDVLEDFGIDSGPILRVGILLVAGAGAGTFVLRRLEDAGIIRPVLNREPVSRP